MKKLLKHRFLLMLFIVASGCLSLSTLSVAMKDKAAKPSVGVSPRPSKAVRSPLKLRDSYALKTEGIPSGGDTRPVALAAGDFNADGAPDLLTGYASKEGGFVMLRLGNLDAFAPSDPRVFEAIQRGQMPDSFMPGARTIPVPEAPDFLLAGDFDRDGLKDVLVGARGGGLNILAGDGAGNFGAPRGVKLSGALTALATGTSIRGEGLSDVAVGIEGSAGPQVLVFVGGVNSQPISFALPAVATSLAFGNLDKDGYNDLAIAAGAEVDIVHGWGATAAGRLPKTRVSVATDLRSRVERVSLPFNASALANGYFVWNRDQLNSLAVQSEDGALYTLQRAALDRRPLSPEEVYERTHGDQEVLAAMQSASVKSQPPVWPAGSDAGLKLGERLGVSVAPAAGVAPQATLAASFISYGETADLFALSPGSNQVVILRGLGDKADAAEGVRAVSAASQEPATIDAPGAPIAFLEMPRKANGERDIVTLAEGSPVPNITLNAPAFTITVDRTDDVAAASACTGSPNDCSLRGAVAFANANSGGVQINIPANTYNITLAGAEDANATGDLDLLANASGVAFVGAGAPTTIIQVNQASAANERIFQVTPGSTPTVGWTGTWSGLTMQNGGSTGVLSGGAILMGGTDNIYNIFSCTFNNNNLGGNIASNGGAISQSAKQNGGCGQATIINSTFTNNTTATGIGGAFRNLGGTTSPGTEFTNITGGLFDNNQATTNAGGAIAHTLQTGTSNYTKIQFTNNKAYTTGAPSTDNGGGAISKSNGTINVNFCRFRGNVAGTQAMPGSGEGVQLGGNGDLNAVNNWWGCNVDPQSAGANAAGCDTAFKVSTVTGTLTTLPQLVLKNTANPAPIVTGQTTTLTASVNTNSANQDVSQNVIALIDLPVTWGNAVRGNLSNQQTALQSLTRTISSATESGTTVTFTTSAAHGFTTNQTVIIAGVSDSRYTGTYTILSTPTTTTFTVTNPITGLPNASGGTAKVSVGTATATFRASAAGAGSADATAENAVATANFTINKADTTTTITSDTPDPTVTGQSFTVSFSLAVNAPGSNNPTVPTGNVQVTADTGETCTGAINAATPATGTCNITIFNAGNRSLTATYLGDANFNASPASSPVTAHVVNKADTTTTITSDNPDPSVTGQSVTVVYSVTVNSPGSAGGTFSSGNVVVTDNGNTFCTATVAAGQCSAAPLTAGAHSFVATYQGDANYNASPGSTAAAHTVNKADTTTSITSDNPDPSFTGQSVTVVYSVAVTSPGGGTPTGNVVVTDNGNTFCTATVAAGQCSAAPLTAGAHSFVATYQGDANYNASPGSTAAAHTVNKANTTAAILTDTPDPSVTGQPFTVTYSVAVTSPGAGTPTGNVQVSDGVNSCTGTVAAGQCSLTLFTAGNRSLTATYQGDANYNASPASSPATAHTVNKADTTAAILSDTPDPSLTGQAVMVTYSVAVTSPGSGTPTGNVQVSDGVNSCTGTVAAGQCSITLNTEGNRTLTATYQGDTNYNASPASAGEPHVVNSPLNVFVNDAKESEPASGTRQMLFTVTLDNPAPAGGLSVNFATADQAPGAGHAVGGASCDGTIDYVSTSGTLSIASGQKVGTVPVTICADNIAGEPDETLLLNISSPSSGTIQDNQAVGTITQGNTPGTFIISELRTSGPGGLGDDFVELYNNTNSPLTVAASDGSAGFGLYKMGADCNASPVLIATIPNGTVIPARGHYLVVGSQYTLANYGGTGAAAGNVTMTSDIESDRNVAVFSTATVSNISSANRLDAVGFGTNTGGGVCDLLREGTTLAPVSGSTTEHSFFRTETTSSGGNPKDTNDNASDLKFADTQGTFISGIVQQLGAPGPENLASPIRRDTSGIGVVLLDGTKSSSASPNRDRSFTANPPLAPNGTLSIRRRVTNTTGASVTRLRFRIVDMTTFPIPGGGVADLRAITSSSAIISGINDTGTCASTGTPTTVPCQVTAQGTTLETPPAQPNGGGVNSTLSVTLPGPGLANNASIDVNFTLGVVQSGTFRFLIIVEALP